MRLEQWVYALRLRLPSLLRRGRVESELDGEIRDHCRMIRKFSCPLRRVLLLLGGARGALYIRWKRPPRRPEVVL